MLKKINLHIYIEERKYFPYSTKNKKSRRKNFASQASTERMLRSHLSFCNINKPWIIPVPSTLQLRDVSRLQDLIAP